MISIIFENCHGKIREVQTPTGLTLMETAVRDGVEGIDAECGGSMVCATCHVVVDSAWAERVGEPNELEAEMLKNLDRAQPNSRLSCQIRVTESLDGLRVKVPQR